MDTIYTVILTWYPGDATGSPVPFEVHAFPRMYDALRFIDHRKELAAVSEIRGTLRIDVQERSLASGELNGDVLEYAVCADSPNTFSVEYRPVSDGVQEES